MSTASPRRPANRNRTKVAYVCENCGRNFHPLYTSARRFCSSACAVAGRRAAEAARIANIPPMTPGQLAAVHVEILEGMREALAELRRIVGRADR